MCAQSESLNVKAYVNDLPSRQAYLKPFVDGGTATKPQAVEYACLCAEGVLHILAEYPEDGRLQEVLDAVALARWLADPTEANRQAAGILRQRTFNIYQFAYNVLAATCSLGIDARAHCSSIHYAARVADDAALILKAKQDDIIAKAAIASYMAHTKQVPLSKPTSFA